MSARRRGMLLLGAVYRLLYRLPVVGDPMVRWIGRSIAFMGHHSPYGMKDGSSLAALRRDLEKALAVMDIGHVEIREGEGKLELILRSCPYGFHRPEHVGVCDAAMEQDRAMVGYVGAGLSIDESIPRGSPACRISIHPNQHHGVSPELSTNYKSLLAALVARMRHHPRMKIIASPKTGNET